MSLTSCLPGFVLPWITLSLIIICIPFPMSGLSLPFLSSILAYKLFQSIDLNNPFLWCRFTFKRMIYLPLFTAKILRDAIYAYILNPFSELTTIYMLYLPTLDLQILSLTFNCYTNRILYKIYTIGYTLLTILSFMTLFRDFVYFQTPLLVSRMPL